MKRGIEGCRTWLFVPGADPAAHARAARSGADVIILELEDFTPPGLRPRARALAARAFDAWRRAGATAAVRVNPLEGDGRMDLESVLPGKPDVVLLPKVVSPAQIKLLESLTTDEHLVPNLETAAGLVNALRIGTASPRVSAMLLASEDLVADLGTTRTRGGAELAYARQRFLLECRAAGVEAIDCPYTFSDVKGATADAKWAKRMGYRMKSAVDAGHVRAINRVLTVQPPEVSRARKIISAFESARRLGKERARVAGKLVEVPIYAAAKRLLASAGRSSPRQRKKRR
ncbi:MAG TPA: CoA ester lyase [Burkholderiales bacterium]|jgi:citrate lyase subunit beta/citryl-CoA lyase|nr:CoA ester lyase [Burkholderiales bacterium]